MLVIPIHRFPAGWRTAAPAPTAAAAMVNGPSSLTRAPRDRVAKPQAVCIRQSVCFQQPQRVSTIEASISMIVDDYMALDLYGAENATPALQAVSFLCCRHHLFFRRAEKCRKHVL